MNKLCFLFFLTLFSYGFSQNCPNRIGDFIINETSIYDLSKICDCNETGNIIENSEMFVNTKVTSDMIDADFGFTSTVYELKPDIDEISGWFNKNYACVNDFARVFFIPHYKTENISIKNLTLKFREGSLFYMKASISKDYLDILAEKYKGKGIVTLNKRKANKCSIAKLKKFQDNLKEISFISENKDITAYILIDNKINSDCTFENTKNIEIFNPDLYILHLESNLRSIKKNLEDKIENDKKYKIERLKKF